MQKNNLAIFIVCKCQLNVCWNLNNLGKNIGYLSCTNEYLSSKEDTQ